MFKQHWKIREKSKCAQDNGDIPDGWGVKTYSDGAVFEGQRKKGKANGLGTTTYKDGAKYEGELKEGKPEGLGAYVSTSG
jgi:hypothetical protein